MQSPMLARFTSLSAVLVLAALAAGCDKKDNASPPPAPSGAAIATDAAASMTTDAGAMAMAADASAATADATDAGAKASAHMANCPTAAPGAVVALKDVEGGIEVSITGKDDATAKDIKARMAKLVEADKNQVDAGLKHDHSGSGGGGMGHCTVVMRKTKLETADLANGVKATVKALDKSEVDWLRRETRERDKDSKMAGADGTGTHHMAHCPSAVPGAKTAVKDAKDGVVVTVTGSGDSVKDIRDRAKHASEISKMTDPPKIEHNSEGLGGGGLGHCPVIVEGDTVVDVKDIDNGSEITVKAKKDVPGLQKEAKARAASFASK